MGKAGKAGSSTLYFGYSFHRVYHEHNFQGINKLLITQPLLQVYLLNHSSLGIQGLSGWQRGASIKHRGKN